jgi:hypothetical protein
MLDSGVPDDLKLLWKELSANPPQISPDQLRKEAEMLKKGLRRKSVIGFGAVFSAIAGFTLFFFLFPNSWQRIGSILTVMGAGYSGVQLRMRRARTMPDIGQTACVAFYRAELERRRDFHRGKWFWSRLLIFLPGPLIFCVGFVQAYPEIAPFIWLEFATLLILCAIAVPLNLRSARRYQHRIDALDESLKSTE